MKLILFILIALSSSLALGQSPWTQTREETIDSPAPTEGIQQISLQIVVDESSEWARAGEIRSQVTKASGIFRKCGVELGKVQIKYVRYSTATVTALKNPNPYKGPAEMILTQGDLTRVRPAMFLFGKQIDSTAKAFNETSISRLSAGSPVDVKPLRNITLLSGHHRTNDPVPGCHSSYSTFAHELAHLLGDIDHVSEANNLMSSLTAPGSKTGHLSAVQCAKIREYSLLNFSGLKKEEEDCP